MNTRGKSESVLTFLLVLLANAGAHAAPESYGLPDGAAVQAIAEQAFVDGTALREDAARARPAFARAAIGYDYLWQRGRRNPELAQNRARAHRLADDLPGAIAAIREGLAVTPWSRPLQVALEDARSAVGYPLTGDLVAQCRPVPRQTIVSRVAPTEAWVIVTGLWLLVWGGVARFVMTRSGRWLIFAGVALVTLTLFGGLWLQDDRRRQREAAEPLVIVTEDAFLRRGNSESYLPRLEPKIPRGVEARELTRRGGWVQVRLAGGIVGWLPERDLRPVIDG